MWISILFENLSWLYGSSWFLVIIYEEENKSRKILWTTLREETDQRNGVTKVNECKSLSQTNIYTYIWIFSNLLPAPFILLSPVSWSATGSQVEIRHHEPFKKTNRLPVVHQVLTNAATENGWYPWRCLLFSSPRLSLPLSIRAAHCY